MKKPFEYMSTKEWLGDATTHFMKSGDNLRSPDNTNGDLAKYIPREVNGVRVEYDISYNQPGIISGYKFTDLLTKALYIAPQSADITTKSLVEVMLKNGITEEGRYVLEQMKEAMTDKYMLEEDFGEYDDVEELIVIPGTNIIKDEFLDMEKIDKLVADGAYIKLHPITSKVWETMLTKRWGDRTIPPTASLYPVLRKAKKVWFTSASETGLSSAMLGKKLGMVQLKEKYTRGSFNCIYTAIDRVGKETKASFQDRLAMLFSAPETGILTTFHENPGERVQQYFDYMKERFPHKVQS